MGILRSIWHFVFEEKKQLVLTPEQLEQIGREQRAALNALLDSRLHPASGTGRRQSSRPPRTKAGAPPRSVHRAMGTAGGKAGRISGEVRPLSIVPDAVVLDLQSALVNLGMERKNALETAKRLKAGCPTASFDDLLRLALKVAA